MIRYKCRWGIPGKKIITVSVTTFNGGDHERSPARGPELMYLVPTAGDLHFFTIFRVIQ